MASEANRTIVLAEDQSSIIDDMIRSGRFRTETEVVSASLLALQKEDAALDHWLREDVVPVVEAMRADPKRGRTVDEVFDGIRSIATTRSPSSRGA